tara:strand:+ start:366 stop:953 length:588 start_codon:yes stop_codon:yes gene_type:complete
LSKIIIYSASKWLEKDLSIKKIDINYFSEVIELNVVKIKNNKNFSYENIFEAEKIIIKYNLNTILKDLVEIDYLRIQNTKFYLEFDEKNKKIVNDNIGLAEKKDVDYKPKIYPKKKKDKNILIVKTDITNSQVLIKMLKNNNEMTVNLSDMIFNNISNKKNYLHYKDVFKIILNDLFFKVPDRSLKDLIKNSYKF